jgi:cell division protein FtsB
VVRWLSIALFVLLVLLQIPLWIGEGSFRDVRLLKANLEAQRQDIAALAARNAALEAEVRDLKRGGDALEERARAEMGLIGPGETFFQVLPGAEDSATAAEDE